MSGRTKALLAAACGAALVSTIALAAVASGATVDAAVQSPGSQSSGSQSPRSQSPVAQSPGSRLVSLVTGEQVRLTGTDNGHLTAALIAPAGRSSHFTTMGTPTAQYVIPEVARPYLGRELDLSLFNVTSPPTRVQVTWRAGASRHPIPGLSVDSGRVDSGAAFGAALRRDGSTALAGIAGIRAASPVEPTDPSPHFPLATLVVKGLDRAGAAVGGGSVSVVNLDDAERFVGLSGFFNGTVAFSVPVGRYTLSADIATPGEARSDSIVVLPEVTVSGSQTVVSLDARTATAAIPIPQTPEPSQVEQFSTTMGRVSASGAQVTTTEGYLGELPTLYITPVSGVATGALHWYSYFRLTGTNGSGADGEPYLYDVEFPYDNEIPAVQPDRVDPATLARLDTQYHSDDVAGTPIAPFRPAFLPWERFAFRLVSQATAPLSRAEYVTARPDLAWVNALVWRGDEFNGTDQSPRTVYRPGQRAPDVYLTAPLVPGAATGIAAPEPCTACRQDDTLGVNVPPWSDGTHSISELTPSATLTVTSDTELFHGTDSLWHSALPTGTVPLPAGPSDLRLVVTTEKSAAWTTTATHTSTAWTWRSDPGGGSLPDSRTCPDGGQGCALEPLLFLAYDLGADTSNAAPAGQPITAQIRAYHQMFDTAPVATELTLDVSTDDGATWVPVETRPAGTGTFSATLPPAAAGFLSLRAHASDPQGDAIDQTVIHAVRVTG